MKNALLFFILTIGTLSALSQNLLPKIDFETPLLYAESKLNRFEIKMGGHFNNIWQVGHPQKNVFDSAYSGKNVIITDTINPYPKNINSYFDVFVYDVGYLFGSSFNISFKHRYNTTKYKAGGYILVSTDNKINWDTLINKDNIIKIDDIYDAKDQFGIYSYTDTLAGGMPAFSGTSNGWQSVYFSFGTIILKKQPLDTLIFRFIFQSDSTSDTKDGWMIDDIIIGSYPTSIINRANSSQIILYPNPTQNSISIKTSNNFKILKLSIKDILGKEFFHQKDINQNLVKLHLSHLPKGQYIIEIETDKGLSTQRLILQ